MRATTSRIEGFRNSVTIRNHELTVDEEALRDAATDARAAMLRRAGIDVPDTWPSVDAR